MTLLADRRARLAVAALFFTNGALFANLIPRYPQIKTDLGLSNAAYGLSVAAFPAGALVAGLAAGVLIRRFGSATVAVGGTLLTATGVLVAGLAPAAAVFAAALFLAGAMDAITDVAQNAHGLRVQRRYRRSIINSFHAIWSIGAVTGGAMAAAAIALGLPIGVHLAVSGVVLVIVALAAHRFCLSGPESDETTPADGAPVTGRGSRPGPRIGLIVGALVLIAIGGTIVEDAGSSWAALYLSGSLHAAAAIAAAGYIALVGAQFVGRMIGDRLVDRFGQRTVARAGGLIVAAGMGLALAVPTVAGTILGFAAAGFGVATLVPAAMHEADELPGLRPGTGLTVVSWLMRLGFLLSPPVVGAVADATSLRAGLLVVPAAGVLVVLLAGVLGVKRQAGRAADGGELSGGGQHLVTADHRE
jgi:MFS family permease